jgi:hypothetical protein
VSSLCGCVRADVPFTHTHSYEPDMLLYCIPKLSMCPKVRLCTSSISTPTTQLFVHMVGLFTNLKWSLYASVLSLGHIIALWTIICSMDHNLLHVVVFTPRPICPKPIFDFMGA